MLTYRYHNIYHIVVKRLKVIILKKIREEFAHELREYFWNSVLRAVDYFICIVGEINDEIIKQYVEKQGRKNFLEDGFNV